VAEGQIAIDDPRAEDVRELLRRHLVFANTHSPPEDVHALDVDGLLDPAVAFYSFRRDGKLLGIGALKQLDRRHGELKSMHTAEHARRRVVASAMLHHIIREARAKGHSRLSLETGAMPYFEPARAFYRGLGFSDCGPFGIYAPDPNSVFMTLAI